MVATRQAERPDFRYSTFPDLHSQARLTEVRRKYISTVGKLSVFHVIRLSMLESEHAVKHCDLMLSKSSLLPTSQYNVLVSDPMFPCGAFIAVRLKIPHIAILRFDRFNLDAKATGAILPRSYVPSTYSSFTDKMTFLERMSNALIDVLTNSAFQWTVLSGFDDLAQKYVSQNESTQSVVSRTDVWLYTTDSLLDFPRPTMPNIVHVGGLHVRESKPLSMEMEDFMESSGNEGVIVVSFGSIVKTMPMEKAEILASAFSRLRQKVVWRYGGKRPPGLGDNTRLMDWLPQNDLLGHPRTRAFVTHTGAHGVYEALYHGVPMVCLPTWGDQTGNAARIEAHGVGIKLDFDTITTEQLYQAIVQVTEDVRYKETAARLSRLHRDQPQSPMERAVWWIEHVIKYGGLPHLRARAMELPWYQYYLLDVAAFLLVSCSGVLWAVWRSCSFICSKSCLKSGHKLKSQ
ncbi:UDP-glucuronosyltransferase 2A3-like [Branchiostoma floridae x Branchiostoma japonicum]